MQDVKPNLFMRDDTFFGVCEGLGEDLGIPSNLLRLGFAGLLWFNALAAVGIYAGLGLVVFTTRWFVPNPRLAATDQAAELAPAIHSGAADNDPTRETLPIAA